VNLDKFKKGLVFLNKRQAGAPVERMVEQLVAKHGDKFRALVMPSANMYDIEFLRGLGVRDSKILAVERDSESFEEIRSSSVVNTFDAPLDVGTATFLNRKRFHWVNLDITSPIGHELFSSLCHVFARGLCSGGVVSMTAICGREQGRNRQLLNLLCRICETKYDLPTCGDWLEGQRVMAMFCFTYIVPLLYGWRVERLVHSRYSSDTDSKVNNLILAAGKYRRGSYEVGELLDRYMRWIQSDETFYCPKRGLRVDDVVEPLPNGSELVRHVSKVMEEGSESYSLGSNSNRVYQRKAARKLERSLTNGESSAIADMCTASGKTRVLKLTLERLLTGGKRALLVSHDREILRQDRRELNQSDKLCATFLGHHPTPETNVYVETIQTMISMRQRRPRAYRALRSKLSYMALDEVHHYTDDERMAWSALVADFRKHGIKRCGVTGTAFRYDGRPILEPGYEDQIVFRYTLQQGVNDGYVAEIYGMTVRTHVTPVKETWVENELNKTFDRLGERSRFEAINHTLHEVRDSVFNGELHTLLFVKHVREGKRLSKYLVKQGWRSQIITSSTPQKKRQVYYRDFRAGRLDILVNIRVISEGVDLPNCNMVGLVRSTSSPVLYSQMIGRGVRVTKRKKGLLVVDFEDNLRLQNSKNVVRFSDLSSNRNDRRIMSNNGVVVRQENNPHEVITGIDFDYLPLQVKDHGGERNNNNRSMYLPYCMALVVAHRLCKEYGIRSILDWTEAYDAGHIPSYIPRSPQVVYAGEWESWFVWCDKTQRPFAQTREWLHTLGFSKVDDWRGYCLTHELPPDIPRSLYAYKDHVLWKGLPDILGVPNKLLYRENYIPQSYDELRAYVLKHGFTTMPQWEEHARKPENYGKYPVGVAKFFPDSWRGTEHFFGHVDVTVEELTKLCDLLAVCTQDCYDWFRECVGSTTTKYGEYYRDLKCKFPANPELFFRDKNIWGKILCKRKMVEVSEAKLVIQGMGLRSLSEYMKVKRLGLELYDLPISLRFYYDKPHENWFSRCGYKGVSQWVRENCEVFMGAVTKEDWLELYDSGKIPVWIPRRPDLYYRDQFPTNWSEFLQKRRFLPVNQARDIVRPLGLENMCQWVALRKKSMSGEGNPLFRKIPVNPQATYSDQWEGDCWFFGSQFRSRKHKRLNFSNKTGFWDFERAHEYILSKEFPNQKAYFDYVWAGELPHGIPRRPESHYDEWVSYSHWIGNDRTRVSALKKLPFAKARACARRLKLKGTESAWKDFVRNRRSELPKGMPISPEIAYKRQWKGWYDFLVADLLDYERAKELLIPFKIESRVDYSCRYKKGEIPEGIPPKPGFAYKNRGWKGVEDFFSIKQENTT